jgi:hypothetical protein
VAGSGRDILRYKRREQFLRKIVTMGKKKAYKKKITKRALTAYYAKKKEEKEKKKEEEKQKADEKEEGLYITDDEAGGEEKKVVNICELCTGTENKDSAIDICDRCQKYFCMECVNDTHWRYECDENDMSYHHFCSEKCLDIFYQRFTFPCDGGCIALLSRRKQSSRYWGKYLTSF